MGYRMLGMPAGILGGGLGNKLGGGNAGGGTPPWNPISIAGLLAWYDFSDPTTLFTDAGITPVSADGDLIYQINDKSGNGRNQTQVTGGNRATYKTNIKNGLSVGRGDGNDYYRYLVNFFSPPFTIFAMAMATGSVGIQCITGSNEFRAAFNANNQMYAYAGTALASPNNTYTNGTYYVIRWTFNGATSLIHLNGAQVASGNTGAGNPSSLSLFAQSVINMLTGDIGDFLLYSGVITGDDATYLENGLSVKWAI